MLNPKEEMSNEKDSVVLGASLGRNAEILDPTLAGGFPNSTLLTATT
jgi:hypothetical protein